MIYRYRTSGLFATFSLSTFAHTRAGFMLFVEGGLLDVLEGYCYGETWPEQGAKFNLSYMPSNSGVINAEARNWKSLNKVLDEALKKA